MSEESAAEKEHEPTPQKLEEARKKGEVVKSADVSVAASYLGFLIVATGLGSTLLMRLGSDLSAMIANADRLGPLALGGAASPLGGLLSQAAIAVSPWLLAPLAVIMAGLVAQRAIVFAPEKIEPKLNRINPLSNAGQKFGRAGLFEFAKSAVKLVIIGSVLGIFLSQHMPQLLMAQQGEPAGAIALLGRLLIDFATLSLIVAAVFAVIDYFWQRHEFMRRNRMSRQELLDEMKHSEGDPHIKGQRRQRAIDIATNQMLADVPSADVVVVNPTHFAVALKWSRGSGRAPVLVAKGVDNIAARIREVAQENGVPIRSDPPTARAIYATIEIGAEIERDHYKAVAAAIRYAEMIRKRARGRKPS